MISHCSNKLNFNQNQSLEAVALLYHALHFVTECPSFPHFINAFWPVLVRPHFQVGLWPGSTLSYIIRQSTCQFRVTWHGKASQVVIHTSTYREFLDT